MSGVKRCFAMAGLVMSMQAWSQSGSSLTPADRDLERTRIEAVRQEKTAAFDAQERSCLVRFAVTDCKNRIGVLRRQMLADLKRQEAALNDADRMQRAAEQEQRTREKQSGIDERRMESTERAQEQDERKAALQEKQRSHQQQAKPADTAVKPDKAPSGLDAASIEKNRQAHAEKLRAAEQRRIERDQRLSEKGNGGVALPINPP